MSSDACDLILNTLTFTTKPSLLGSWGSALNGFYLRLQLYCGYHLSDPAFSIASVGGGSTGQFSIKNGLVLFSYTGIHGATVTACQFGVDLAHLHFDCGSGQAWALDTQPD